MARIEFFANPTRLPKRPRPRSPPPSGRDEIRNSVDYISELPDAIILHIFSFLDTKDSIRTSVLSKRWRSTWTANPRISFGTTFCLDSGMFQSFMAFMDAVRSRCTAIKVKSFLFDAPFVDPLAQSCIDGWLHSAFRPIIDRWLRLAVGRDVEEVSMTLRNNDIYALPQFFFRCTTLVSFHVSCCRFSMMDTVNWCSLKRLRIEYVELDDDAMMRILSGCPVLEFFKLEGCQGFKGIRVKSRVLRELVIKSHQFPDGQVSMLKISAPHLLKLRLLGNYCQGELREFRLDNVSSLVEAELNFKVNPYSLDKVKAFSDLVKELLERLHHVTRLVIGSWHLQVLSLTEKRGGFLPSLECRHLMFHVEADHKGVPNIVKILGSSPRLEKLSLGMTCTPSSASKFIPRNTGRRDSDAEEFWNSAKRRTYQCLVHLKNVEIIDPGANWLAWEPVLSLLKFLLQNARSLDKIEINSNNSKLSKRVDPWVLLEVARIILSDPNRSPSLKFILNYPSRECPSESVHLQGF